MKIYTGIGSRAAPERALKRARLIAERLRLLGWLLRSGGAVGMDSAFERGAHPAKEIYRPGVACEQEARKLFDEEVRPLAGVCSLSRMRPAVAALLARNMPQVLGLTLDTPSRAVLCWTPSDDYRSPVAGGTRYACLLAQSRGIPIFNLATCGLSDSEIFAQLEALA